MISRYILRNMNLLSARMYKAQKRRQLRKILQAIGELRIGSVAMPPDSSRRIAEAAKILEGVQADCRVKSWGR